MEAIEALAEYMRKNGFDGLYNPDGECGCHISDMPECEESLYGCNLGHKWECLKCEKKKDCDLKKEFSNIESCIRRGRQ
jgi:hypothetical protein